LLGHAAIVGQVHGLAWLGRTRLVWSSGLIFFSSVIRFFLFLFLSPILVLGL
jgi:hypothetical protein